MRVMFDVTNPVEREHTMTKRQDKSEAGAIKALLTADGDFLRSVMQSAVQAALEAEMTEALSAERSERAGERRGYRSGSYSRSLITRAGTIECVFRATGRDCSRPSCLNATSGRRRRW
jgi:putative transposase